MAFPSPKDGISITDVSIDKINHLIITLSDNKNIDAGLIPTAKGDNGFTPTIAENPDNTNEIYKLDITNEDGMFTTPNLKGAGGGLDPDKYYDKTQIDAFIEPLDKAKHTHDNKETVLDKLTTNDTGDTLLFNGNAIKGSVEIDDTTTTATDKVWSAKKTNDTFEEVKQSITDTNAKFADYDTSAEVDGKITTALADKEIATKEDIPTTLPANGGNSDTLDGLHANEIASNPNLLINPDFRINQRGETAWSIGTTHAYFVDRWYSARTNLSLSDDGLMLAWNGTDGSDGWIQEKVETKALFGKTVTISVNANDKIYTITDTIPETVNASTTKLIEGTTMAVSLTNHGGNTFAVVLHSTSTTPSLIRWIKCELGRIATPFVPPDPATELLKCQRYFIRLKNAFGWIGSGFTNKTLARCVIPLPTTMRISPTVTLNGKIYANTPTGLGVAAAECTTARSDIAYMQNAIGASFDLPEGSTSVEPCFMQFRDSESYIDISAEL